jgi:hypothetical protein
MRLEKEGVNFLLLVCEIKLKDTGENNETRDIEKMNYLLTRMTQKWLLVKLLSRPCRQGDT